MEGFASEIQCDLRRMKDSRARLGQRCLRKWWDLRSGLIGFALRPGLYARKTFKEKEKEKRKKKNKNIFDMTKKILYIIIY